MRGFSSARSISVPRVALRLLALMRLERQDIEAVAHRVVEFLQVDDAAVGGSS